MGNKRALLIFIGVIILLNVINFAISQEVNNSSSNCNDKELCNGIDDNCDGKVDEGFNVGETCYSGTGACQTSLVYVCSSDMLNTICNATPKEPSEEICNNKDDDCDGIIDNNIPDAIDGIDIGNCKSEIKRCFNGEWKTIQERIDPTEELCNNKDDDCDGEVDEENVCISLNLFSPENKIYNTNNIQINLSLDLQGKSASKLSYIDNSLDKPREIILCKNCKDYGYYIKKFVKFRDGMHNVLFNAINNENNLTKESEFMIDKKKPKINLPRIRAKAYTNGTFSISYSEDNIDKLILYYKDNEYIKEDCPNGKEQKCEFYVDLSEYQNKEITYSIKIIDIAGNFEQTKNMTAVVDIIPPIIEETSYPVIGNYIYFRFKIIEDNFQEISYLDNSSDNPKWRILCSALKNGICEKEQRFKPGDHYLTIRVIDKAGNSVFGEV